MTKFHDDSSKIVDFSFKFLSFPVFYGPVSMKKMGTNFDTGHFFKVFFDYLQNAQKLLENDGREALRKAEERSKKFGEESEKMSAIAREARTLAEQ